MGAASGGGDCARAANQGSVEQHLPWLLNGGCARPNNQKGCSDEVVHSSRIRARRLAQLSEWRRIDAHVLAPKLRDVRNRGDVRPCRQRRHDRCCFGIAPSNFRAWQTICRRRDGAIRSSPRPTSSLPSRPSGARQFMPRPRRARPKGIKPLRCVRARDALREQRAGQRWNNLAARAGCRLNRRNCRAIACIEMMPAPVGSSPQAESPAGHPAKGGIPQHGYEHGNSEKHDAVPPKLRLRRCRGGGAGWVGELWAGNVNRCIHRTIAN